MSSRDLMNANIHRAKEGARVLEDIARYILRDEWLFSQIRQWRHGIQSTHPIYLLDEDLGDARIAEDNVRANLTDLIQANSLRMQEAVRVLEEFSTEAASKQKMKEARYRAYEIHSKIYYAAKKFLKMEALAGLYLIIDPNIISQPIDEVVNIINQSPVNIIQYRNKASAKKAVFDIAYQIKKNLHPDKVFIINDHIDIALDLADGVHIGQNDYPLAHIRHIIPDDFILGISCHDLAEARAALSHAVSYIGIGSLFATNSKQDATSVSIEELQKICREVNVPVCAIGGINADNLDQVVQADIKMVALISYVWRTDDPVRSITEMHERVMGKIRSNIVQF